MRQIVKGDPPAELADWIETKVALGERADFRVGIPNALQLRLAALREQFGLCCYTGRAINDCTLEHIKPYSVCKAEWVDTELAGEDVSWTNLVGAEKTYVEPHYGESIRKDWFDADYISPLEPDCGSHFTFALDGTIGFTSPRGEAMIAKLRLDSNKLNEDRLAAIEAVLDPLVAELDNGASITDFLRKVCAVVNGRFPSFSFVLESALPQLT